MDQHDVLKIAQASMKTNKDLLKSLGDEKRKKLAKNPDQDIIKILTDMMPKSTEGKILAVGVAILVGYLLLKSK